jgi:HSP20 family protein
MNTVANRDGRSDARVEEPARPAQKFVSPEMNIFETKEGYILEAEIPGVNKEGLELTLEGNELTIVGRREKAEVKAAALYRESAVADYRRVFELDPAVDTTRIDAKVDQGVLTVRLPKSERVKPRKVTVND